jgi:hypothetical protein
MNGQRLLDDINTIRAVQGRAPISAIRLNGADLRDPASCAIALATVTTVARGIAEPWRSKFTLRFARGHIARMVGVALDQPFDEITREVLATDVIRSFVIAASHGLVFEDTHGMLHGWIDPTDEDPSAWNLHLMPGREYPRGHGPRSMSLATGTGDRISPSLAAARAGDNAVGSAALFAPVTA